MSAGPKKAAHLVAEEMEARRLGIGCQCLMVEYVVKAVKLVEPRMWVLRRLEPTHKVQLKLAATPSPLPSLALVEHHISPEA